MGATSRQDVGLYWFRIWLKSHGQTLPNVTTKPFLSGPRFLVSLCPHHQPCDFSLVRARQALPGEDARGPNKHLILGGNVPAGATLGHLSNNYGIVVDKVEPEVLNFPALHANCAGARSSRSGSWEEKVAPGGEGPNLLPPPSYSVPPWSGPGERVKVVQLWGLTHCVNPAYERLVAVKSNQWKQCLRLGACDVLSLGKSVRMRQNSATVSATQTARPTRIQCLFVPLFSRALASEMGFALS